MVSRQVPYKRVCLIAEAFAQMPDRQLVIVGDGPGHARMLAAAGTAGNITMQGAVSTAEVCRLMQAARTFVVAAEEDFGITMVEAQAGGTPLICYGKSPPVVCRADEVAMAAIVRRDEIIRAHVFAEHGARELLSDTGMDRSVQLALPEQLIGRNFDGADPQGAFHRGTVGWIFQERMAGGSPSLGGVAGILDTGSERLVLALRLVICTYIPECILAQMAGSSGWAAVERLLTPLYRSQPVHWKAKLTTCRKGLAQGGRIPIPAADQPVSPWKAGWAACAKTACSPRRRQPRLRVRFVTASGDVATASSTPARVRLPDCRSPA